MASNGNRTVIVVPERASTAPAAVRVELDYLIVLFESECRLQSHSIGADSVGLLRKGNIQARTRCLAPTSLRYAVSGTRRHHRRSVATGNRGPVTQRPPQMEWLAMLLEEIFTRTKETSRNQSRDTSEQIYIPQSLETTCACSELHDTVRNQWKSQ